MKKYLYKVITPFPIILIISFMAFMLIFPDICKSAAIKGLLLCSNVIIPTLFPFTFCVIFIINSSVEKYIYPIKTVIKKIFRQSPQEFAIMILSFIGGYPVGAKLISRLDNKSNKKAQLMLCYCVNAGPGFIVMAIGQGIMRSKEIGYILLVAHIIPPLIMALILRFFTPKSDFSNAPQEKVSISDNIVISASDSASAVMAVCGYVILFSAINSFLDYCTLKLPFIKYITPFLEVTSAVAQTKNVYLIAFLTGFGGICVWCQVKGMAKGIRFNFLYFAAARIFHGFCSLAITRLLLKFFKITIPTISNGVSFKGEISYSGTALTLSLLGMGILFIISTFKRKTEP
ncbi:MAG: hypothetical protein IKK24_03045 [Clostridia bacterium]|nr:hypothetical protein [Clostridia bacterium]